MSSELHVMHVNINSLRPKSVEVTQYITDHRPDVVCFNETKLNGKDPPKLPGYRVAAYCDRVGNRGGGVAIYARNGLLCSDVSPEDKEDVAAIELRAGNQRYCVVSYYRPPYDNIDLDTPMLVDFATRYDRLLVAGDLNAKHFFFGSRYTDRKGEDLFDWTERCDMIVANSRAGPTRHVVNSGYTDLIDYIIVSKKMAGALIRCFVGDDVSSDHLPVHATFKLAHDTNNVPTRETRLLHKGDWQRFSAELIAATPGLAAHTEASQAGIDAKCDEFEQALRHALDAACPIRTIKSYAFKVTQPTLDLIREKRKLRRKLQKNDGYLTAYNNLKRQVDEAIKAERRAAWERATETLNHIDGHKFWQKFKCLTGTGKGGGATPRIRDSNGVLTNDQRQVAQSFAESLGSIHRTHEGPEFCADTKATVEASIRGAEHLYVPQFTPRPEADDDSFLVDVIDVHELRAALKLCKSRSAAGPDGIGYSVLKRVPDETLAELASLYSLCLCTGYFPVRWKLAHGVMLAKSGKDLKDVRSYRPISLLNTTGKLFERIVARRLQTHFVETNFFNVWQQAYQPGKEAAEILYRLGEEIRTATASGKTTTVVSLDVEKAFDSVWHDGLRAKLSSLELPAKLVRLLSSFLTDRTVRVRIGSALSDPVRLEAGTPQGSVLSPLLYLIYVNDLPVDPYRQCRAGQFADDMNLWTSDKKASTTRVRLQRQLTLIEAWCSKWRIKLNVAKTQLFSTGLKRQDKWWANLNLTLFGERLNPCKELKVLGLTFDRRFSMTSHCRLKRGAAARKLNLMRTVSGQNWGASERILLKLYKQYVRPVLEYGSVVTAEASPSALKLLGLVERRALRIITQSPVMGTRIGDLYAATGIEPIAERLKRCRDAAVTRFGDNRLVSELKTTLEVIQGRPR